MKKITPKCDHCDRWAQKKIRQEDGDVLHLCRKHEDQLKRHLARSYKKLGQD